MANGTGLHHAKYVLEGRIVTMTPMGSIADGAIYVDAGEIKHVLPATHATPAAFLNTPRIRTGDTIYPGLIELHNHLSYNAMPLWDVPNRFTNNGQWRNHDDYRRLITKPSQVLGGTASVVEALVRFVECRALLGGVTTSQGITLASQAGIKTLYKGLVRNVEQTRDPQLPEAHTRIANPSKNEAAAYLAGLQNRTCYLQHLSEGTDPTARSWFLNLQLDNGDWAITEAFCGIHSTALTAEDFRIVHAHGGSMVWSPLSNFLLYGDTVDIQAAKDSGILIGLGSDWGPSGSKNLLGELKVAWLTSEARGGVFTPAEIVAMATHNAARILKWESVLGSIQSGRRADFMVLNGQQGDDFMRVINARETSITLVTIDGIPRVGQPSLMQRFGLSPNELEELEVGRATRLLYLTQEETHPLLHNLGLGAATKRLQAAMHNLPALARALDEQTASGFFAGSTDTQGTHWRVFLDFEEEETDLASAAQPLADFVTQGMQLEGITVADDPTYLSKLIAARNLQEFIKKGLPPLYGEEMPLPPSALFLNTMGEELPPDVRTTVAALKTFLRTWGELTPDERQMIVTQALLLLEHHYVHLPFKQAMHAVNPIQQLKLLRYRMEGMQRENQPPEIEFHNELTRIFNALRDLHTCYRLPYPFKGKVAWLPFLIEEFWENGYRKYLISKVVGNPGPPSLQPGVEVLYWNGMPLARAVSQNAERHAGSNQEARHAQGLNALTLRPLSHGLPPEEEWVTLRYMDADGVMHEWTQEWLVFEPEHASFSINPETLLEHEEALATALGLDPETDEIHNAKRILYAGDVVQEERRMLRAGQARAIANLADGLTTFLPTVFRAKEVTTEHGTFGYLRIFTFNVADVAGFIEEAVRLITQLPESGLIIDVRGNGGGLIPAAERLLQIFTPRQIEPQKVQFINSPLNLQLCRNHDPSEHYQGLDLAPWVASMAQAVATGAVYSQSYPLTPWQECNDRGQQYYGPLLLITDALCYSATDMFAAGFQDHHIGPILGICTNTGAGGANVWSHAVLQQLMSTSIDAHPVPSPYVSLPHGADLRVAIRRTIRVHENAGMVVEDLGIQPEHLHAMTRHDLMQGNIDLITEATRLLATQRIHTLRTTFAHPVAALPRITVTTQNVTRLDIRFNGRTWRSFDVQSPTLNIDLQQVVSAPIGAHRELEIQGFEDGQLVAAYRQDLNKLS
jgi:cytosine/adenosine deaminase-related metal-dependent hydrolase